MKSFNAKVILLPIYGAILICSQTAHGWQEQQTVQNGAQFGNQNGAQFGNQNSLSGQQQPQTNSLPIGNIFKVFGKKIN